MRQEEAVKKVYSEVMKDKLVKAVFLKGSIARGECDEYSDVDFYCMVDKERREEFLSKRILYLKSYKPLIYYSEENFVAPQIVAVFEDGLHFDLYTVTKESLHCTDEVKVLYDPAELLKNYKNEKFLLNNEEIAKYFDEITFMLLEFEAAYMRNDLIWASRLGSHISGYLSIILRYIYDKDNARLGLKRLYKKMDSSMYEKYKNAVDLLGPTYLPEGVVLLCEISEEILGKLPEEILERINKKFFYFMFSKIKQLSKED
ncbi:nucleotidyltransferase domain-containing protein [Clostridium neuense]|uniref:Nucleotidyltransferase domain-containing protein n=1 Tax=Clostridium neuense TaxID=1728934 RepID=A0ABW8TFD8_9CLOT